MVSGLAVDGLVSGLDTTSLINSLMTAESQPQTLLKAKVTDTQSTITALQGLNSQVAALATLATTTKSPTALSLFSTTSSSTNVTATASTAATPGTLDIVVGAVAQAKVGVSAAMTAWPDSPPKITIVGAAGTAVEISPASSSIDDVVSAVNSSAAGVKAVKVASGKDASGAVQYRLQFTSNTSGAAGSFEIYRGTGADVTAGTATNVLGDPGAAVVKQAQDARVTLWAGTSAEQTITSATNTFADLLPGVSVTVNKASTDPIQLSVARDQTASSAVAGALVTSLNNIFSLIQTKSATTTSTDSTGKATVSGGPFTGDSTVRGVNQALITAASMPVNGRSPSEIGISINRDGSFDYDAAKFQTALATDPVGTQTLLTALASRVADAATQSSDKYSGQITSVINGQKSLVTSLSAQVSEWDLRLTDRRASLEKIYSNLEVQLSTLKAQQSSLSGSLSSLSSSTG
ncbi:Flagellar hook-associated protein 2 [Frondihabitans sp. 762G35]|uniref:flagellar filament capping protein FliD n=1 Tax=Frondihabitans sp. 762G35 TaxID=1446794 RepID=UPI000D21F75B|nr:flagellar filament capping protein FliD [Frondihabitans sp. 762G35]ARC55693.1 Flagellar hook-associated protein 2 [Frondihabitans sp. 762G35]